MFPLIKLGILIIFYISFVNSSPGCDTQEKCGKCISYELERCVWCSEEPFNGKRCQPEVYSSNTTWCKSSFVTNPQSNINVIMNTPFGSDSDGTKIQFKPQEIYIKARPGVSVNFTVSYQPAADYPLDVYYLMDISYTMKKNRQDLIRQANVIYDQLKILTNNVLLGVGSFVEKPLFPYYDNIASEPLTSYSFRNDLNLTEDIDKFVKVTQNMKFGANFDGPEAGLDALMQAMTCFDEIGWRNDSRRIIVLCTDSTYHSAGDGKMLGIIKPNDMKCHLENDYYSMSTKLDYPSVSQINKVASDRNFIIIFAIKLENNKNIDKDYMYLSKQILGSNWAELKEKSNIVDIIKDAYLNSVRTMQLTADINPSLVEVIFDQDCNTEPKRKCNLPAINANLDVNVTVKVKNIENVSNLTFVIRPVSLGDKLKVNLDIDNQCDCEKLFDTASPSCSDAGFIQCGICKCNDFRYGDKCQCNSAVSDNIDDMKKCKKNPGDKIECSDHGTCICGKCECSDGFSGNHCEFDDKICANANGKLCAGNGYCSFGKCNCYEEWTGNDCNCPAHDRDCKAPFSDEVCSGNGVCRCGQCKCGKVEGRNETYTGIFCDSCHDCPAKYCKQIEDYAYCNYLNDKTYCDEVFVHNTTTKREVKIVNKTEFDSSTWQMATVCRKEFNDGSFILFKYVNNVTTHTFQLIIQKEKEEPPIANIWVAVASAIVAVILIGLLTLIVWKILMDMHDKREFKKFVQESRTAGFDVSLNPLYQDPAVSFTNPTYVH